MDLQDRLSAALAGRYEIEREIGRGGMAVVYLARDQKLNRRVAIKAMRPEFAASLIADRFLQEIQIAAQLQHPLIVPLHESGASDGLVWYVMPFVDGESLRDRLNRERQLPLNEALRIARGVADALCHAHERGVVHRDIKPENIMLSRGHALVVDFGVARAVAEAGGARRTSTGVALGTVEYMSPEQGSGEPDVDARSDIYSLGCVVYEMLTGEPPFSGPSPQAIIARHLGQPAPSASVVRPSVRPRFDAIVQQALAKQPVDRFQSAAAFRAALEDALRPERPPFPRWGWPAAAGSAAVLGVALWVTLGPPRGPPLDPLTFVVADFRHREGAAPELLSGDYCQWRLSEELRQWREVSVVDRLVVEDWLQRVGERDVRAVARAARRAGAGRMVLGEVAEFGDTVRIRATLHESRNAAIIRQAEASMIPNLGDIGRAFRDLAAQLLGLPLDDRAGVVMPSRSIAAIEAYTAGRNTLVGGAAASEVAAHFRAALDRDPDFVDAHLWLAQLGAWSGTPGAQWRTYAERAVAQRHLLSPGDRALSVPLSDLARGRIPQACDGFHAAIRQDSSSAAAWAGLAECLLRDTLVVPDSRSASGRRFRSSYQGALAAYEEALARARFLTPVLYERLSRVIRTESGWLRAGSGEPPDTTTYLATASLVGDSVEFIPFPARQVQLGSVETRPPAGEAAIQRGRALLQDLLGRWMEDYPRSFEARYRFAIAQETAGQVARGVPGATALELMEAARGLARTPRDSIRAVAGRIRLLVKSGQFEAAAALTDSLVRNVQAPPADQLERLAALAALGGQVHRSAEFAARGAIDFQERGHAWMRNLPLSLLEDQERASAYAAWDLMGDSVRAIEARLVRSLESLVSATDRNWVREQLLEQVYAQAYFVLGPRSAHRPDAANGLLILASHLERGDASAVRAYLARLDTLRSDLAAGDLALFRVLREAQVRLAIGDTSNAVRQLDLSLGALSQLRVSTFDEFASTAALGQIMSLRSELAARSGDWVTAARWAEGALALWNRADRVLENEREQLRARTSAR